MRKIVALVLLAACFAVVGCEQATKPPDAIRVLSVHLPTNEILQAHALPGDLYRWDYYKNEEDMEPKSSTLTKSQVLDSLRVRQLPTTKNLLTYDANFKESKNPYVITYSQSSVAKVWARKIVRTEESDKEVWDVIGEGEGTRILYTVRGDEAATEVAQQLQRMLQPLP